MREDIELFATALLGRYGEQALDYVILWAERLAACGDHEGHDTWMAMADLIKARLAPNAASGTQDQTATDFRRAALAS